VILAVLNHAYCVGERSSRRIERRLVGLPGGGANQQPEHATLTPFRGRHQAAIAGLFTQVLTL
jgi:hypothetical protein